MVRRFVVSVGASIAVAGAVNAAINIRLLRKRPPRQAVTERVSILVPARNEARHIEPTVRSLLAQDDVEFLDLVVLDDGSTDETAQILAGIADDRLTVVQGADVDPPPGWLGKPWACARLAAHANHADVVVFADADVEFAPHAISTAVTELREGGYALLAPFPQETAVTFSERLFQPLLNWVWLTTVPIELVRRTTWPPLAIANGQFLVFDAAAYRAVGGHECVRGEVVEDIAIMRKVRQAGLRAAPTLGADLARCRMYRSGSEVVDGYAKSLWSAFGGPVGTLAVVGLLTVTYLLPPVAMLGRRARISGAIGTAAGVANRLIVARATGERVIDAALQPLSASAFITLNALSWFRHVRGRNRWKGRSVLPD